MVMQPYFPKHPSLTYFARFILLALVYAGISWISLTFIPAGTSGASLVWPVAAIGLAGLLFWGLNLWPALMLGIFVILMTKGYTPPLAAGVSFGNTLEALIGAAILLRSSFHPIMSRLRDTLGLVLAAFTSTFASLTCPTWTARACPRNSSGCRATSCARCPTRCGRT